VSGSGLERLKLNVAETNAAGVRLEPDKGWCVGPAWQSAAGVGVVELGDLHAVELDGVRLALDADLIGVPLARRVRRLQVEGLVGLAVDGPGAVLVGAVGDGGLIDLDLEAEVDPDVGKGK
jgi:hypothetical protein